MDKHQLKLLVSLHLNLSGDAEPWSGRSGAVLASDLASIRHGKFYLMGMNPAGMGIGEHYTITANLHAPDGTNSYADQCWICEPSDVCPHLKDGRLRPDARSLFQHRVCDLFDALGRAPADVLSTNLIFARSTKMVKLANKAQWKRRCWNVHRELLRQVRPDWIVMLGFGEAFAFVQGQGQELCGQQPVSDEVPDLGWHCRMILDRGSQDELEVGVLGVAHPGKQGFNRAGLGASPRYPSVIRRFIEQHLLGETLA